MRKHLCEFESEYLFIFSWLSARVFGVGRFRYKQNVLFANLSDNFVRKDILLVVFSNAWDCVPGQILKLKGSRIRLTLTNFLN